MKTLAAICCAALLAAPSSEPPAEHGPIFAGMPPERFMRETGGVVLFVANVEELCGKAPKGYTKYGCAFERNGTPVMVVPHPCIIGANEFYSKLLCHETAHWNGWGANHEL